MMAFPNICYSITAVSWHTVKPVNEVGPHQRCNEFQWDKLINGSGIVVCVSIKQMYTSHQANISNLQYVCFLCGFFTPSSILPCVANSTLLIFPPCNVQFMLYCMMIDSAVGPNGCRLAKPTSVSAMDKCFHLHKQRNVITHSCPNFNCG